MWGFQSHGVVPDIVTMAKGIANGFPMGAIVTTPGGFNRRRASVFRVKLQRNLHTATPPPRVTR